MSPLRRFRALPRPAATSTAARLVSKMREKAGPEATMLSVRARPHADRRKQRV